MVSRYRYDLSRCTIPSRTFIPRAFIRDATDAIAFSDCVLSRLRDSSSDDERVSVCG